MLSFLMLLLFVVVTIFIGANIVLLMTREYTFGTFEFFALSYILGTGAVAVQMSAMWLAGLSLDRVFVLIPWVLIFALNIEKWRDLGYYFLSRFHWYKTPGWDEITLVVLLLSLVFYTFLRSFALPVEAYDSVSIWALKSKVIWGAHIDRAAFFNMMSGAYHGAHADYPLLTPFSQVWFYSFINGFNDSLVKFLPPSLFVAFLFVFFAAIENTAGNRWIAVLFTFILASIKQFNDFATICTADMAVSIFASVAFLYLFLWRKYRNHSDFIIGFIAALLAFWTKNEGVVILMIYMMVTVFLLSSNLSLRKYGIEMKVFAAALIVGGLSILSWMAFKSGAHVSNDVINPVSLKELSLGSLSRIWQILYEYQRQIFGFKKWNLTWIVFLYFLIVRAKDGYFQFAGYILWPLAIIIAAYTAVYFITPQDLSWHLRTTASRLLIHLVPLAVFFIALNVREVFFGDEKVE